MFVLIGTVMALRVYMFHTDAQHCRLRNRMPVVTHLWEDVLSYREEDNVSLRTLVQKKITHDVVTTAQFVASFSSSSSYPSSCCPSFEISLSQGFKTSSSSCPRKLTSGKKIALGGWPHTNSYGVAWWCHEPA